MNAFTAQLRVILYNLSRLYGERIDLYQTDDFSINPRTGERTLTRIKWPIRKAISLPEQIYTDTTFARSLLALTGKEFTSGGVVDTSNKDFIIRRNDLPYYVPKLADYIIWIHKRYNITKIITLDNNEGYYITTKRTENEPNYEIHDPVFKDKVTFVEALNATKN